MTQIEPDTKKSLIDAAIANGEGVIATNGALSVSTGKRTGRSPKDRFIVIDAITDKTVAWNKINQPIDLDTFNALWLKATIYLAEKTTYTSRLSVGASDAYNISVTVTTELAWHNVFVQNLFINSHNEKSNNKWTILNAAKLKLDPIVDKVHSDAVVIINFTNKKILLCGTEYAGEMKKAMFSVLNFLLPERDVLPMHCSANVGNNGDVALFFGLSGTGKTTLSADPQRLLIGDDEHGWSATEVFNFEGGCYAKCIDLSAATEPSIYNAIIHGSVMENVVLNNDNTPDYTNVSLTQNTRAAYPLEHITPRCIANKASTPNNVVFLCCDLYGVLPAVSKLTVAQAKYYFLLGYTALVGSTEVGSTEAIKPTFSPCFGAPFFVRPMQEYADLLEKRVLATLCNVYLVNTGWHGGPYGKGGTRYSIPATRKVITAILDNTLATTTYKNLDIFDLAIPANLDLDPRDSWSDKDLYNEYALQLKQLFDANKP